MVLFNSALNQSKKKNYHDAENELEEAKKLAPKYFEVYRCIAWIKCQKGDIISSKENYEIAIDLEPEYGPLRFLYGGLLLRNFNEVELSEQQFQKALQLDKTAYQIKLEFARVKLFSSKYKECEQIINELFKRNDLPIWFQKKLHDLNLQLYHRQGEYLLNQRDYNGAIDSYKLFQKAYFECPFKNTDKLIRDKPFKAIISIKTCFIKIKEQTDNSNLLTEVTELKNWIENETTLLNESKISDKNC